MTIEPRRFLLSPDGANRDPFRGLPSDFPSGHSRFPMVPVRGYGDLSFDPANVQNCKVERSQGLSISEQLRWREAVQQALGDLVEIRLTDWRG
jgi:hypothetical protein